MNTHNHLRQSPAHFKNPTNISYYYAICDLTQDYIVNLLPLLHYVLTDQRVPWYRFIISHVIHALVILCTDCSNVLTKNAANNIFVPVLKYF